MTRVWQGDTILYDRKQTNWSGYPWKQQHKKPLAGSFLRAGRNSCRRNCRAMRAPQYSTLPLHRTPRLQLDCGCYPIRAHQSSVQRPPSALGDADPMKPSPTRAAQFSCRHSAAFSDSRLQRRRRLAINTASIAHSCETLQPRPALGRQ